MTKILLLALTSLFLQCIHSFLVHTGPEAVSARAATVREDSEKPSSNDNAKRNLLKLIGNQGYTDPVLADPDTKEPLRVVASGVLLGGDGNSLQGKKMTLRSTNHSYKGTASTFINLLQSEEELDAQKQIDTDNSNLVSETIGALASLIPPPLRCKWMQCILL
jgi:hypothetical protein